jgi:hypothetical protein
VSSHYKNGQSESDPQRFLEKSLFGMKIPLFTTTLLKIPSFFRVFDSQMFLEVGGQGRERV